MLVLRRLGLWNAVAPVSLWISPDPSCWQRHAGGIAVRNP